MVETKLGFDVVLCEENSEQEIFVRTRRVSFEQSTHRMSHSHCVHNPFERDSLESKN
jgi:hypothetical protein